MQNRQLQVSRSVYLALGTNLGNRLANLQNAIDALGAFVAIEAISPIYETEPWGIEEQPLFYNICVSGRTTLDPRGLLQTVKDIEQSLGRKTRNRWGPREIDIDIIFYSDKKVDEDKLHIPHPSYRERAFVLAPLAAITPDLKDPLSGRTVAEQLEDLDTSVVRIMPGEAGQLRRPPSFAWGAKTYVMGILNLTPDSFSGDGILNDKQYLDVAVEKAIYYEKVGVDIIDIGGESTRPGSQPISMAEEIERVIPAVSAVRDAVAVPLSIDTYRSQVAAAALDAGANWINDVWGFRMDDAVAEVAADYHCPVVIMHNRSRPKNVEQEERLGGKYVGIKYESFFDDILREMMESVDLGLRKGIKPENVIVDPGIGFGKSVTQNLMLVNGLGAIRKLGYPILVGPSRKSFIGYSLDLPPSERMEGTAAAVAIAIDRGADIIRIHDAKEMVRVARMTDSLIRGGF